MNHAEGFGKGKIGSCGKFLRCRKFNPPAIPGRPGWLYDEIVTRFTAGLACWTARPVQLATGGSSRYRRDPDGAHGRRGHDARCAKSS